jgi:hypothetical protein
MPMFKPDAGKQLNKDLATATATKGTLVERLKLAEELVPKRQATAKQLAQEGATDVQLDDAEQEVRRAQDRVTTLSAALSETEQQIISIEQQLAELVDQRQRVATAADIEARAQALESIGQELDDAFSRFMEIARRAAEVSMDAEGLKVFSAGLRAELPPAIAMAAPTMSDRAAATLLKNAPAVIASAPPVLVKIAAPEPVKTERYFVLNNVAFLNAATDTLTRAPRFSHVDLTEAQAAVGLRANRVCPMADPRVAQFAKMVATQQPPLMANCHHLDTDTPPTNSGLAPVVAHPAFEKPTIGQPRTIVHREPPVAAARNADLEHDDE